MELLSVIRRWAFRDRLSKRENSYAWFFRMRDGKVVSAAAFLDPSTCDAALAAAPLPHWPNH